MRNRPYLQEDLKDISTPLEITQNDVTYTVYDQLRIYNGDRAVNLVNRGEDISRFYSRAHYLQKM